ncbi:death domain-associated protein 6 isoform X2 [Nasonia vitripennis]|uniref:Daxx histone-binding domain-containing protein n=1 Tax=Nasonia vitripennis TaxID=7425 RepID=A0A7M7LRL1_NASVI|nr:death domain-associated protein 6 isoform X2 [Nasonia vitripennis]
MTDVICISSSEDEEDSSKLSDICQKRKSSISLDDTRSSKRCKVDDENKLSSDSNKPNKNLPNTDAISPEKHSNEPPINKCISPKPGPSKQHNNEQEFQMSHSDSSSASYKSSPMKKIIKPQLIVRDIIQIPEPSENVFMKFVESCKQKNPSEETKKILSKLKKRFDKLDSHDKDDEEFQMFLKISLQKVSNDSNDKFYTYIQEVHEEVKRRSNRLQLSTSSERESSTGAEQQTIEETKNAQDIEISKQDMKKVKKIEKAIRICLKRIRELEEKEVDFDAEENSAYLQEDRYKRKLVELCNSLSDIVGDRMLKKEIYKKQIRRKDIPGEMTGISTVDEAIISFINTNIKQVNKLKHIKHPYAIADYLLVPDYPDILDCIVKCDKEKDLELTKKKMEQLAKTAFKSIGSYLKKQRVLESEEYISSFIDATTEPDPAAKDPELNKRLQNNKKEGDKKLEEIFKKYVDKQEGLSVEELENLNDEESAHEDESDGESSKANVKKKNLKSEESNTSIIDVKELSSHSKDNSADPILVIEDDDDIQILSDDDEENTESKSNNKSGVESKEKLTILRNTNSSPVEDTTNIFEKEETNCAVVDITKDDNDNIHATSLSTDIDNIKNDKSISTSKSFLDKDNKPKSDDTTKKNEVVLESILPSKLTTKNSKIMEINEVGVLPDGHQSSNNTEGPESAENKNSSTFIKVCSFAKPPESWKDTLSPEKAKKNMQLPIQQALQDLSKPQYHALNREKDKKLHFASTLCINPLAANRIDALPKNVLLENNQCARPQAGNKTRN